MASNNNSMTPADGGAIDGGAASCMSLRDAFATAALIGLISTIKTQDDAKVTPKAAYAIADLMLAERAK